MLSLAQALVYAAPRGVHEMYWDAGWNSHAEGPFENDNVEFWAPPPRLYRAESAGRTAE